MTASFSLTLDTTTPEFEITAPQYTTQNSETTIAIKSNESLSNYQDIYYVDSTGEKIDLTFEYKGDSFIGSVKFNKIGFVTLYARVKDEVFNVSEIASRVINVRESAKITAKASHKTRSTEVYCDEKLSAHTRILSRNVSTVTRKRNVDVKDKVRWIEVSDY